jgi:broad specificity phosphatase PhoE
VSCFVFIRHGETDHTGSVLSGRLSDVHLNQRGREQAADLPRRLGQWPPDLICSSPLERCLETAEPLAREYGLDTRILPDLLELNYGNWTGQEPAALDGDEYWQYYNRHRSTARIDGGELLVEAQVRMLRALETMSREMPGARIAVIGHSDPIKAVLGYLLGLPLDFINRLRVDPASVSVASLGPGEPRVHCINHSGDLGSAFSD